jgi:uncharacterized membrane protein YphA (DoxX/SURF4 family)
MSRLTHKLEMLADSQHSKNLDLLRIALGLIIFAKGVYFIQDTEAILTMMHNSKTEFLSFMITHYVAMAHLVGGVLITIGLLTRVAILFQIPILLGAVFLVNIQHGFFSIHSELEFSILVLLLLLFFLFYGSGPLSVDDYMKRNKTI